MNNNLLIAVRAKDFALQWKGRGNNEIGETQLFWTSLLTYVFGIEPEKIADFIQFEDRVPISQKSKGRIDAYIPKTKVLIEQKKVSIDLDKPLPQSDGSFLTPFEQAKKYSYDMPASTRPNYIVTCNFREFHVYDLDTERPEPQIIKLENLDKEYYRLQFLVDSEADHIAKEMNLSFKAGEIIGKIYQAIKAEYKDKESINSLHSLSLLCVRLVFCLYAEDADLFNSRLYFHDYLQKYHVDIREALIKLFEVLDQPEDKRDPYLNMDLKAFPYINGGLFADRNIEIPYLTDAASELLLQKASLGFDWSGISPTIFGALFESTLNPITRRSSGMHYTSIENIHKIIDPLFLDDLKAELARIKTLVTKDSRIKNLIDFQNKLASIVILDPAAGSGNFLTESYLSLRRLENEAIREMLGGQTLFSLEDFDPIKVSINQFYGIEINDFAVTVAKTALWIAEHQMMRETESIIKKPLNLFPLSSYNNIVQGNACRMDWGDLVPKSKLTYIISNPPFLGKAQRNDQQREDMSIVFPKNWRKGGSLDYVACWFKKASEFIKDTSIKASLVATNSITQGELVKALWEPLFKQGIQIDFAYKTFKWDSEASDPAQVYCVIIGFGDKRFSKKAKKLFDNGTCRICENINGYLSDEADFFLEDRNLPISEDAPKMIIGRLPVSGGRGQQHLVIEKEERELILSKEPEAAPWIRQFSNGREFIEGKDKYCLWLEGITPAQLKALPLIYSHVKRCQEYRSSQKPNSDAYKLRNIPHLFRPSKEFSPDVPYLALPQTSTSTRDYIPIGFVTDGMIPGPKLCIIHNASLYAFGVLMSKAHMIWTKAFSGSLGTGISYSITIIYNNFPWPKPTEAQRKKIEKTAQRILDARALFPDSSLSDLYDKTAMTVNAELLKAHEQNDKAVFEAYGIPPNISEADCINKLKQRYLLLNKKYS